MNYGLSIPGEGALDFVSLGALVHRIDPGNVPFRKATECQLHVSGGEFNQPVAPASDGSVPSTGSELPATRSVFVAVPGRALSSSTCSIRAVLAVEMRVRNPVSNPNAMATTPSSTNAPSPRLIHSPAPSDFFIAANTRPPIRSATASDVAAPAA